MTALHHHILIGYYLLTPPLILPHEPTFHCVAKCVCVHKHMYSYGYPYTQVLSNFASQQGGGKLGIRVGVCRLSSS